MPPCVKRQLNRASNGGIGLRALTSLVCSPHSNGCQGSVKPTKRDYVAFRATPHAETVARNPGIAVEHYNEQHSQQRQLPNRPVPTDLMFALDARH